MLNKFHWKVRFSNILNLKSFVVFFFSISTLLSNSIIVAEMTEADSLIQAAITNSIQHNYQTAESLLSQVIRKNPHHPQGYFFMAATIQSKMMDFETDLWADDFLKYIKLSLKYADEQLHHTAGSKNDAMFYKGSALSYLSFYEGRQGKYLAAINYGFKGVAMLKKLVKIQPDFYDAYFAIGSFKYWRSQVTKFINWLPIIDNESDLGIEMVRTAIEKGKFTKYAAMNQLIWIFLDAGKPDSAFQLAEQGLQRFPNSRFFLWGAAKSALVLKNYPIALQYFQRILHSIGMVEPNNHYNEYICRLKLAQIYYHLEAYQLARQQSEILDSLSFSEKIKARLKKQIKQHGELKTKLNMER